MNTHNVFVPLNLVSNWSWKSIKGSPVYEASRIRRVMEVYNKEKCLIYIEDEEFLARNNKESLKKKINIGGIRNFFIYYDL